MKNGKGDKSRPLAVPRDEYMRRWDDTFRPRREPRDPLRLIDSPWWREQGCASLRDIAAPLRGDN